MINTSEPAPSKFSSISSRAASRISRRETSEPNGISAMDRVTMAIISDDVLALITPVWRPW